RDWSSDVCSSDLVERGIEHVAGVGDVGLRELRSLRYGVAVAGRQVVEDDDVVPGVEQLAGDDRPDVAGAAGEQQFHEVTSVAGRARSRRRAATSSGRTSVTNAPIADSDPARYFSLFGARLIENNRRCR